MDRAARSLSRVVCDVDHWGEDKDIFDFDLTCGHPNAPMKSSLAVGGRGYGGNRVTLRFRKIPLDEDPYEYSEEGFVVDYAGSKQDTQLRGDLNHLGDKLEKSFHFADCSGKTVGDQHTHEQLDTGEIEFFHPHIECRVGGDPGDVTDDLREFISHYKDGDYETEIL